jgi:glycolate oxidase iron-sulfur subunit
MQTKLSPEFQNSQHGKDAESILRSCVHCGFCNATCPTYQILGDELDGPRGRIYLIKEMLEGGTVGRSTQLHLDRCLTCLNCETTCPSGVQYGKLVGIGRVLVEQRVGRPWREKFMRWLLKEALTSSFFAPMVKIATRADRLVPRALRKYVPRSANPGAAARPTGHHERKVLLLAGCVQPALLPNINSATARVLDACGIETLIADRAGCCGALRDHLSDHEGGLDDARRNVDAWWPLVAAGTVDAIVMNASACGLAVKQYGEALEGDAAYAEKAARISALARDLSELLPGITPSLKGKLRIPAGRITFHAPCTLQHGQGLRGGVEAQLAALGFDVQPSLRDGHLCCGSAGTYSVLQPMLARELRDRKLANLTATNPDKIASANVGCIQHLQSGTDLPVRHWVELLDEAIQEPGSQGGLIRGSEVGVD